MLLVEALSLLHSRAFLVIQIVLLRHKFELEVVALTLNLFHLAIEAGFLDLHLL